MTGEKIRPSLELTPIERQILHLFDNGPHDVLLLISTETGEVVGAVTDTGVPIELETLRRMAKKGWFSYRRRPNRYVINTKGRRISESRL